MSLKLGDNVDLIFSTTKFHLPADETSPVIMIAAGSGIAPFRSFWLAKKLNPMYLFFGCQKESDVPFKSELDQLEKSDRLTLYPAYSRSETNAQYVQDKVAEESDTIHNLLLNSKTTIYVCGSPEMEFSIREKLIKIIGKDIVSSCMKLARMKNEGMCLEILVDDLSSSVLNIV